VIFDSYLFQAFFKKIFLILTDFVVSLNANGETNSNSHNRPLHRERSSTQIVRSCFRFSIRKMKLPAASSGVCTSFGIKVHKDKNTHKIGKNPLETKGISRSVLLHFCLPTKFARTSQIHGLLTPSICDLMNSLNGEAKFISKVS